MSGFYTISDTCTCEMKIKRSRFIAHIKPVRTHAEIKAYVSEISTEHSTASHNCWAYVLGDNGEIEHASDQGEPPGTAGKPMLNALLKHKLTYVVIVVTRYFGGTKLGIPGLIDAYSTMALQVIETADVIPLLNMVMYLVDTSYSHHDLIRHQLAEFSPTKMESAFADNVRISFEIPEENAGSLETYLEEMKKTSKIEKWSRVTENR